MKRVGRIAWTGLCCVLLIAFVAEGAGGLTIPKITMDQEFVRVENGASALLTGTVSVAKGQKIAVLAADGETVLRRTTAGKSGGKRSFQVTVPAKYLPADQETVVFVRSCTVRGLTASKKVRVSVLAGTARMAQKITVSDKITLTNLKTTASIKAAADSKMPLTYQSSDPAVARIDESGKVTRQKNGTVKIIISQAGSADYLPAETTVEIICRKSTRQEQIDAAVAWAVKIAKDNSFAYGTGHGAHHNGCYFCGTNYGPRKYMKPSKRYRKTYCCNPFVHAAYAHGAKHPKMLAGCRSASGIGMQKSTYRKFGCWKCVGKPSYGKLKKGDVLVKSNHVAMYIGGHKLVEASGGTWSARSISVKHMSKARYHRFSYVMRYKGY